MHLKSSERGWIPGALRRPPALVTLDDLERGFGGLDERAAIAAYAESAVAADILCTKLSPHVGAFLKLVGLPWSDGTRQPSAVLLLTKDSRRVYSSSS